MSERLTRWHTSAIVAAIKWTGFALGLGLAAILYMTRVDLPNVSQVARSAAEQYTREHTDLTLRTEVVQVALSEAVSQIVAQCETPLSDLVLKAREACVTQYCSSPRFGHGQSREHCVRCCLGDGKSSTCRRYRAL